MENKVESRFEGLVFVIVVTLMGMLFLLPSDIYLPALPLIQHEFATSTSLAQMTLSIFFLGAAVSQIVVGPLVDRFSLRWVGILSIILFIITSAFCMFAATIEQFLIIRFFEACGAGFAAVVARAAITKKYDSQKASHIFLIMSPILAVSPAIAPVIGGFLTTFMGWRSVFGFIVILGLVILVFSFKCLVVPGDTGNKNHSIHPVEILKNYGALLKHKGFSSYLATRCGIDAAYFAYITASPFIYNKMGFSSLAIGNFYIFTIITFVFAAYVTKRLMDKHDKNTLMLWGQGIAILGGIVLLIIGLTDYQYAAEIIIPASIMTAGYGITGSLTWAEAMAQFDSSKAGSASSLVGFFPMLAAAVAAALVNVLTHDSVALLSIFMLVLLGSGFFMLLSLSKQKKQ